MSTLTDTIRDAWNSTRRDTQPFYDSLIDGYREMLHVRAEAAIACGPSGDVKFDGFERKVLELSRPLTVEDIIPVAIPEMVVDDIDEMVAAERVIAAEEALTETALVPELPVLKVSAKKPAPKSVSSKKTVKVVKKAAVKKPTKKGRK